MELESGECTTPERNRSSGPSNSDSTYDQDEEESVEYVEVPSYLMSFDEGRYQSNCGDIWRSPPCFFALFCCLCRCKEIKQGLRHSTTRFFKFFKMVTCEDRLNLFLGTFGDFVCATVSTLILADSFINSKSSLTAYYSSVTKTFMGLAIEFILNLALTECKFGYQKLLDMIALKLESTEPVRELLTWCLEQELPSSYVSMLYLCSKLAFLSGFVVESVSYFQEKQVRRAYAITFVVAIFMDLIITVYVIFSMVNLESLHIGCLRVPTYVEFNKIRQNNVIIRALFPSANKPANYSCTFQDSKYSADEDSKPLIENEDIENSCHLSLQDGFKHWHHNHKSIFDYDVSYTMFTDSFVEPNKESVVSDEEILVARTSRIEENYMIDSCPHNISPVIPSCTRVVDVELGGYGSDFDKLEPCALMEVSEECDSVAEKAAYQGGPTADLHTSKLAADHVNQAQQHVGPLEEPVAGLRNLVTADEAQLPSEIPETVPPKPEGESMTVSARPHSLFPLDDGVESEAADIFKIEKIRMETHLRQLHDVTLHYLQRRLDELEKTGGRQVFGKVTEIQLELIFNDEPIIIQFANGVCCVNGKPVLYPSSPHSENESPEPSATGKVSTDSNFYVSESESSHERNSSVVSTDDGHCSSDSTQQSSEPNSPPPAKVITSNESDKAWDECGSSELAVSFPDPSDKDGADRSLHFVVPHVEIIGPSLKSAAEFLAKDDGNATANDIAKLESFEDDPVMDLLSIAPFPVGRSTPVRKGNDSRLSRGRHPRRRMNRSHHHLTPNSTSGLSDRSSINSLNSLDRQLQLTYSNSSIKSSSIAKWMLDDAKEKENDRVDQPIHLVNNYQLLKDKITDLKGPVSKSNRTVNVSCRNKLGRRKSSPVVSGGHASVFFKPE